MTHPLALSVINESSHLEARVQNRKTMTKRAYAAYILALVTHAAKIERRDFNVRHHPNAVTQATQDVIDHMNDYAADCERINNENSEARDANI